ncbi:MAG: SDR family oxidoreductase [Proteobacteria bacterium]|nr:SDR family oxidoreductase [Pseudomonadota bacterium]
MAGRLQGRVAVVTGGASGIGAATGALFAAEGARVAFADLDAAAARRQAATVGHGSLGLGVDVVDEDSVMAMAGAVREALGPVDILVNSAGIMRKAWVKDMPRALWDQVLAVNLTGTFLASKAVLPDMIAKNAGRIVNIASIAGKVGEPTASAYSASKFGVIGFTRSLAIEVAKHNVLVNAICPGPIATPLGEQGWREGAEIEGVGLDRIMTRVNGRSPLGRLGTVEQVARMAAFIASDDCDFTTGSAFNVDGGIIMT